MTKAEKAKLVKDTLAEINKIRVEWGAKRIRHIRKGVRFVSSACPVAVSLAEGSDKRVVLSQSRILWWPEEMKTKSARTASSMVTPPVLEKFITEFDSDQLPEYLFDPWALS